MGRHGRRRRASRILLLHPPARPQRRYGSLRIRRRQQRRSPLAVCADGRELRRFRLRRIYFPQGVGGGGDGARVGELCEYGVPGGVQWVVHQEFLRAECRGESFFPSHLSFNFCSPFHLAQLFETGASDL